MSDDEDIVRTLRDYDNCHDGDVDMAVDMLAFFFNQMQAHSPHMDGTVGYRFRGGWPLTSVRARSREEAIVMCLDLIKQEREVIDEAR